MPAALRRLQLDLHQTHNPEMLAWGARVLKRCGAVTVDVVEESFGLLGAKSW